MTKAAAILAKYLCQFLSGSSVGMQSTTRHQITSHLSGGWKSC